MKQFPLGKSNKLCSLIAIEALFSRDGEVNSALEYPLRAVWRVNDSRKADRDTLKFLISVPKRRLRHAVDRVKMRRRIRESYRLNRQAITGSLCLPLDVAFVYVGASLEPYVRVERSMQKLLSKIARKCCGRPSENC